MRSIKRGRWSGKGETYLVHNDVDYVVEYEASGTYFSDPGCMYLKNGDPGYPPEEDFEVTKIECMVKYEDLDRENEEVPEDIVKEITEIIQEKLESGDIDVEYD